MPYTNPDLGFWYAVRLRQLGPADVLTVNCRSCKVGTPIATWQMHARYHPDTLVCVIASAAKCRACGGTDNLHWSVRRAAPPEGTEAPTAEEEKAWMRAYEKR